MTSRFIPSCSISSSTRTNADVATRRIAEADDSDETQQLRLESDAHRVQILTLHKSKGLEFPFVFLPFAAIGRAGRDGSWCEYHDGDVVVVDATADGTLAFSAKSPVGAQ